MFASLGLFRSSGVFGFTNRAGLSFIAVLGWILASSTLYAYYMSRGLSPNGTMIETIWNLLLVLHLVEMVGVFVESLFTTGFFWPLQMFIIGNGSFITFMITALTGASLVPAMSNPIVDDEASEYAKSCIVALATACFSNGMMLSMMFEHFHRGVWKVLQNQADRGKKHR